MNLDKNFCIMVFRVDGHIDTSKAKDREYLSELVKDCEILDGFLSESNANTVWDSIFNMFNRILRSMRVVKANDKA